jgi:hypothetical protein
MDVIECTPTRDQYAYTFGGVASAMQVRPGTALRLWSDDAFGGVLRSVDDRSSTKVDLRFVNPQTGRSTSRVRNPATRSCSTSSRWNRHGIGAPRRPSPSSAA